MKPGAAHERDEFARALDDALAARPSLTNGLIAEEIGLNTPNVISQWKYGWRPMPARYASKIASVLGIAPETISAAYAKLKEEGCLPGPDESLSLPSGHARLGRLDGFGREHGPHQAVLPLFVVEMKIGNTPLSSVRWVLQPTGAMAPLIPQGSLVLLDSDVKTHEAVVDGGIYAYTLYGRPYVRRVLIGRDAWSLCGYDAGIERVMIRVEDLDDLCIHGAILGWL